MFISLAAAILAVQSPAPVEGVVKAPPDACAEASDCRFVQGVTLRSPQGKALTRSVNRRVPWLPEGNVMLFPGEAVIFRLDPAQAGRLRPVLVQGGPAAAKATLREGEVRMAFGQDRDAALLLTVDNRLKDWTHYAAVIVGVRGPAKTSVCTLMPGKLNIERWEAPILQISLANFQPVKQSEAGCR